MTTKALEEAIRAGDLDRVREQIAAGADVLAAFADGTKPILLAARQGHVVLVRALAGAGAELDDLEPLDLNDCMKLFLGASLDSRIDDDLIAREDLVAWAEQAVAKRMDPKVAAAIAAQEGEIFRAVRLGDLDLLRERLAAGDDVDQVREITRDTPLTRAVQERDLEMVRELIAAGANVNHEGFSTPLSFALPDLGIAKVLLEAGADVYQRGLDHRTPFERAVYRALRPTAVGDSPLLVRFFLETGVHPPNAEPFPGEILMDAESSEAWEIYHELLAHYPYEVARESFEDLRHRVERRKGGGSFIHWTWDLKRAAREGDPEELRRLLERTRDPAFQKLAREEGRRGDPLARELGVAVQAAVGQLQLETASVLIEAGADLDVVDGHDPLQASTPLAVAAESWHRRSTEAMRLLLDAGAAVDQRGRSGRTPLMFAVQAGYRHEGPLRKAVPLLLEAGADPNLEDEFGLTAWSLARAPLVEAEERARLGERFAREEPVFDGPDLSERQSETANKADRRRDRLERCRQAVELLAAAGAKPHGEAELRLVVAAAAGDAERAGELLAAGACADARGPDGKPAIVAAAESGSRDAVARLIAAGCNVDASHGGSAIEAAVRALDKDMTRQLLDAGANVVMLATMSRKVLAAAEDAGGGEVVAMVRAAIPPELANFDRDVAADIADDDRYYEAIDNLPRQAAAGDLDKVREYLAVDGVEVDSFDELRRTALSAAAEAGQVEMVRELIALGADVDKCNDAEGSPRSTPLVCAAISPSAERGAVLRLLLEAGADPDRIGADGRTALMHAVERDVGFFGRVGELGLSTRTLIDAGAGLEVRDRYGLTAWMIAQSLASSIEIEEVAEQYGKIGGLLEDAGASIARLPDVELVWAVEMAELEEAKKMLAKGASPDARRHDGATALMLAVRGGQREMVRLLIDAGADVNARLWLDRGPTARDAAVAERAQPLIRMLDEAGAIATPED